MATALDDVRSLFDSAAAQAYLGEPVTVAEHQLQTAAVARNDGAPDALVVAALLHDVGHLLGDRAADAFDGGVDAHHDALGADWLAARFPAAVSEPVRLHVAAKRYLCATDPAYARRLSPASTRTLALQGGPMTAEQAAAFAAGPWAADAVRLRGWDDTGKDADLLVEPFEAYLDVLAALVR